MTPKSIGVLFGMLLVLISGWANLKGLLQEEYTFLPGLIGLFSIPLSIKFLPGRKDWNQPEPADTSVDHDHNYIVD